VWQSIKDYSEGQDEFNWNYGMALAASGNYQEAEEALRQISNENFRSEYYYQAWLCFCYIATDKGGLAWELYLSTEASSTSFRLQAMCLLPSSVIFSESLGKRSSPQVGTPISITLIISAYVEV